MFVECTDKLFIRYIDERNKRVSNVIVNMCYMWQTNRRYKAKRERERERERAEQVKMETQKDLMRCYNLRALRL